MSKESFKKVLAAVVMLGMVAGTAFVLGSCGKEKTNGNAEEAVANTLPNQGETLLEKMTRIYINIYGDTVAFTSVEIVEQDNGYTVVIAQAQRGDHFLNFGVLAETDDDGNVTVSDTPETDTRCETVDCHDCKPRYEENVFRCFGCGNYECDPNNGGTGPGGGGTPQN